MHRKVVILSVLTVRRAQESGGRLILFIPSLLILFTPGGSLLFYLPSEKVIPKIEDIRARLLIRPIGSEKGSKFAN